MLNQESSGGARVCSNPRNLSHTDITWIYRTCRVSEGSCNMYRVPTMAKFNIFCYAHLLNRFRVNKGFTRTMFCVLYCIALSLLCWVTRAHSQRTVLTKHIVRDRTTAVQGPLLLGYWYVFDACPEDEPRGSIHMFRSLKPSYQHFT